MIAGVRCDSNVTLVLRHVVELRLHHARGHGGGGLGGHHVSRHEVRGPGVRHLAGCWLVLVAAGGDGVGEGVARHLARHAPGDHHQLARPRPRPAGVRGGLVAGRARAVHLGQAWGTAEVNRASTSF